MRSDYPAVKKNYTITNQHSQRMMRPLPFCLLLCFIVIHLHDFSTSIINIGWIYPMMLKAYTLWGWLHLYAFCSLT